MEQDTGHLSAPFRFPIKGLTAAPPTTITLDVDRSLPADRRFAFAEAGHDAERAWPPKRHFVRLARFPALVQVTARVDLDASRR